MSLPEIQTLISQLPRTEQEELLRTLAQKLSAPPAPDNTARSSTSKAVDRDKWITKLKRLQTLTAPKGLRPTQEILDELREDRI